MFIGGECSGLDKELINTDQPHNVATGHILNGFNVATHHQDSPGGGCWSKGDTHEDIMCHSPLNGLDKKIFLLSRDEVRAHNACLQACGHYTREHATKGIETAFVGGGHHFRDIHHQRSLITRSVKKIGELEV